MCVERKRETVDRHDGDSCDFFETVKRRGIVSTINTRAPKEKRIRGGRGRGVLGVIYVINTRVVRVDLFFFSKRIHTIPFFFFFWR